MDINLPLILLIAVAVTGGIWLLDIIFLAGPRKKRISAVNAQFADQIKDKTEAELEENHAYQAALRAAETTENKAVDSTVEFSKSFFPVLALVFCLRSFLLEPFQIPSGSMIPTLKIGDFIVVNKFTYGIRLPVIRTKILDINQPKRGDVVVFFPPHRDQYFIKRLVGLPGDVIRHGRDQKLYINGEAVRENVKTFDMDPANGSKFCPGPSMIVDEKIDDKEYTTRKCYMRQLGMDGKTYNVPHSIAKTDEWVVPEGHYFMMGDNRDDSQDSRVWGFVPEKNIVGKAFAVWMHRQSGLPTFKTARFIE